MLKLIADLSTYHSHLKFTCLIVYVGFAIYIQNLPWFLHLAKLRDGTRSGTRWYGCCSDKNVTWLIMLWSQFWFRTWDIKWESPFVVLAVIGVGGKLAGSQIALAKLSAFWAGRAVRDPHFAWAVKCAGVRGTPLARDALSARAVIARSGEWAALSTHFPRTCHAMPTQCTRGSKRVGRAEPQSPAR